MLSRHRSFKAERSRQRRGKAAMSLTKARQGRGRELEAEARQTKFEARPRRGNPRKTFLPLDVSVYQIWSL